MLDLVGKSHKELNLGCKNDNNLIEKFCCYTVSLTSDWPDMAQWAHPGSRNLDYDHFRTGITPLSSKLSTL